MPPGRSLSRLPTVLIFFASFPTHAAPQDSWCAPFAGETLADRSAHFNEREQARAYPQQARVSKRELHCRDSIGPPSWYATTSTSRCCPLTPPLLTLSPTTTPPIILNPHQTQTRPHTPPMMPGLTLALEREDGCFRPGETIRGHVVWRQAPPQGGQPLLQEARVVVTVRSLFGGGVVNA